MKTLIAGRFSFENGQDAAGDLLAGEAARDWLELVGHQCHLASAVLIDGGVDWREVEPEGYSHLVLVASHEQKNRREEERLLARFAGGRIVILDLAPIVAQVGRGAIDSSRSRDAQATSQGNDRSSWWTGLAPLASLNAAGLGAEDAAVVRRFLASQMATVIAIDDRLDAANTMGLRTPAEVETLLARMDLVVTTRMHGMVLALKHGVPVIAIDPEAGGARVVRQARAVGWPVALTADALSDDALQKAFNDCLTDEARARARDCRNRVESLLAIAHEHLHESIRRPGDEIPLADNHQVVPTDRPRISVQPPPQGVVGTVEQPTAVGGSGLKRRTPGVLARPARRVLKTLHRAWGAVAADSPLPRRVTPVSRAWGYDRGSPVDRYYIETFLGRHARDVRGCVLEVGDSSYTKRFGGDRVESAEILDVSEGNPAATYVADLSNADHLPSDRFDCIILTQTLHLIYDVPAAIRTLRRVLKPGGVLLATFPGITKISHREWGGSWYWAFSGNSARRLFDEVFSPAEVVIECFGNVLSASAFLYGFAQEELSRGELDYRDPEYEVIITARAEKSREPA